MKTIDGYIKNGHPFFRIQVYGFSQKQIVTVEALFDSGFTGFLSLPLSNCLRSALILLSTAQYTLADGSTSHTLLALRTVVVSQDVNTTGAISISMQSNDSLLGMEFLRKIGGKLEVDVGKNIARITNIPDVPSTTNQNRHRTKKKQ